MRIRLAGYPDTLLQKDRGRCSGSLTPSKQDIEVTLKIKEAAKYMDIYVQDHIIITFEQKYFSFADDGLI